MSGGTIPETKPSAETKPSDRRTPPPDSAPAPASRPSVPIVSISDGKNTIVVTTKDVETGIALVRPFLDALNGGGGGGSGGGGGGGANPGTRRPPIFGDARLPSEPPSAGVVLTTNPAALLKAMPAAFESAGAPATWRSDPYVASTLALAQTAVATKQVSVTVFVPLPQSLRPALETSDSRPQAPNAAEMPQQPQLSESAKNIGGVKLAESTRLPEARSPEQLRQTLFEPGSPSLVPLPKDAPPGVRSDHQFYLVVRDVLAMAFADKVQPRPQVLVDQGMKLDAAAREYFAKPVWQKEAGFQRAVFMALLAAGVPFAGARDRMAEILGGRFALDMEHMGRMIQSLNLIPQGGAKAMRNPEEMLLDLARQREVTGGKKKKGHFDRVNGLASRGEGDAEEDTAEHVLEDDDEDEEQRRP